jgi:alkylated DNA repair protein (DNA oxidative demethylase)
MNRQRKKTMRQGELFVTERALPPGFAYQAEFISTDEEQLLLAEISQLGFDDVRMHGVVAKRRVAHFGVSYSYDSANIAPGRTIPEFLLPLRAQVADFAARGADEFVEVLLTEYQPGAPIGWHRDAPAFDIIVGVSLVSACTMQFRRWPVARTGARREKPLTQLLEPRSAYILRGESRTRWQHHIAAAKALRYSVTFRTLRNFARDLGN